MDLYYDKVTGTYGDLSEIVACLNMPTVGDDFTGEDVGFYAAAHGKRVEAVTYRNGMRNEDHEGWTNHPTWAVKLWIDNDQGSYNYWREAAREAIELVEARHARSVNAEGHLMQVLREEYEDAAYGELIAEVSIAGTVFQDLLTYALTEVNWREIAESLISEVVEEDAYIAEHSNG